MPEEDIKTLAEAVTRGFTRTHEQLREREDKVTALSEKMIGIEAELRQINKTLDKVESEMESSETIQLKMRVGTLEKTSEKIEAKAAENSRWIKGLIASVIVLLVAFLLNLLLKVGWK